MSDRNAPINLQSYPFQAKDLGPEGLSTSALTDDGDLVSLRAAAQFAEKQAIEVAIEEATRASWNSAGPLDQFAIDWAAKTDADEKIIHAFLGIDDLIGQGAEAMFQEEQIDVASEMFLETLPHNQLQIGELAALSAFDKALERGFNAEEALSAAIKAAEGVNASITVGAALAKAPEEMVLGWEKASTVQIENEPSDDENEGENGSTTIPFVSIVTQGPLSNSALNVPEINDAAFGFGFQFEVPVVEINAQAENHSFQNRTDIVTATSNAVALTYTEVSGSVNADNDSLYAGLPTNYQASVHDAANSLANAMFSVAGGDVIGAGEVGDDFIWGGSGNNQLHSDVPDTSSALFEELKFGLGSTGGDDTIEGGVGDDSIWGGQGNDMISGNAGDDTIYGDNRANMLRGNAGADNIFSYADDDIIRGGQGDDSISGTAR